MNYVIVDLEATCWEKGTRPQRMEIIEIGAVLLKSAAGSAVDEFSAFVRPVAERQLSEFCIQLTTIRQQDVDQADPFSVVFWDFLDWIGQEPFYLCSWGAYDLGQFRVDCDRHNIPFPDSFENHINLKKLFAQQHNTKPMGMAQALVHAGISLEGTHHRGIDDARNIAKLAQIILPVWEKHRE